MFFLSDKHTFLAITTDPHHSDGTFRIGSTVQLTCHGSFGTQPMDIRWCYRTREDDDYLSYYKTGDIIQGRVEQSDCQYERKSFLTHNVTYKRIDFICDMGETQCGHSTVYANYTLHAYKTTCLGKYYY